MMVDFIETNAVMEDWVTCGRVLSRATEWMTYKSVWGASNQVLK
jgi:hypothetical protein